MAHRSLAPVLALAFLAPLATANIKIHESTGYSISYVPQIHCDIVFQEPGPETCHAEGETRLVTTIKVRVVGFALAHGYVDKDTPDPEIREQVGQFHCTSICTVTVHGGQNSGYLYLHVTPPTNGARGSAISVSLESDPRDLPVS